MCGQVGLDHNTAAVVIATAAVARVTGSERERVVCVQPECGSLEVMELPLIVTTGTWSPQLVDRYAHSGLQFTKPNAECVFLVVCNNIVFLCIFNLV